MAGKPFSKKGIALLTDGQVKAAEQELRALIARGEIEVTGPEGKWPPAPKPAPKKKPEPPNKSPAEPHIIHEKPSEPLDEDSDTPEDPEDFGDPGEDKPKKRKKRGH